MLQFARHYSAGLGRFRIWVTDDPRGLPASKLPTGIEQILAVRPSDCVPNLRPALFQYFLMITPELAEARAEIEKLNKSLEAFPTTLVMKERPLENPRPTFLHKRGEYLQAAEQVQPGVPSILPPLPAGAKPDRLAFARWLVAPENPLTARVTVNRQWAILFGRGLVKTTEDFGLQGSPPSHPELLDWLASEFVKEGWSLKKLHRLIVTSATYRQSSKATPELIARDPENVLLARGPRGRLEAEQLRDATLFAAGLLSLKMGGPSVYPPQAEGVSEVAYGSPKWTATQGFMPTVYNGVRFRNQGDPILDVSSPAGVDAALQRDTLDLVAGFNRRRLQTDGDPEIATRLANYEMAFKLQTSAPELMNLKSESKETLELYGCDPAKPSFARACLLARRMIERGVRFVNLFHEGWDAHSDVVGKLKKNCAATDQRERCAGPRSQAARPARRHARHLGRRVRPHADGRDQPGARPRAGPRSSPLRLHDVDGRRRREAGPHLWRDR